MLDLKTCNEIVHERWWNNSKGNDTAFNRFLDGKLESIWDKTQHTKFCKLTQLIPNSLTIITY